MMNPKECADAWKTVTKIYDETREENNPEITIQKILSELGEKNALEVFATITAIKTNFRDGRISDKNKSIMSTIPTKQECIIWSSDNPMIEADIDHIHTTHIDNLLDVLIMEVLSEKVKRNESPRL